MEDFEEKVKYTMYISTDEEKEMYTKRTAIKILGKYLDEFRVHDTVQYKMGKINKGLKVDIFTQSGSHMLQYALNEMAVILNNESILVEYYCPAIKEYAL